MALPIQYNWRNLATRRVSTWMTALGFTMVVLMFCVIQALSQGLDKTLISSGRTDNLLVMRHGSKTEVYSSVSRDANRVISSMPEIAKDEQGRAICAAERYLTVYLPRGEKGERSNVAVRGTTQDGLRVRPSVKIAQGRFFQPGLNELVVGQGAMRRFSQFRLNGTVTFEKREWTIVGILEADGQAFESEIWGDVEDIGNAFRRPDFSAVLVRATSPQAADALEKQLESNTQLKLEAVREDAYYKEQTNSGLSMAIIGTIITVLLAIGATFGAMNTMYASVSARTREIAVLRAIGFGGGSVLLAFLIESLLLALAGGLVGCAISLLFNGMQTGTVNWLTFSEVAFQFRVTPQILSTGLIFGLILGLVGGLLPAVRASRMTILQALRAV